MAVSETVVAEMLASKDEEKAKGFQNSIISTPMVEVEGIFLPKLFETSRPLPEHVELLKGLEMRESDIVLMAYPKSGTHWIWEVISMLVSGKAEYEKRTKEFAMMEATQIEKLESQPSPRVLNSHLPLRLLPRQIKEKKVKVIQIYRNVKDVFVSTYFQLRQMPGQESMSWEGLEKMFMSDAAPTGNFFKYMKETFEYRQNNPELPFFVMSFEDTKEDPEKVIRNLAEFLGVDTSPELLQDIVEATSLSKMREADKHKDRAAQQSIRFNFYRKGEVGDWKNHLTVAQSERFDAAMMQLESCDYRFRYEL